MTKDNLAPYYAVLELPPGAPLRDVQNAYLRLRRLYSDLSIVLEPLEEEFTADKRQAVLAEVEAAYQKLLAALHAEAPKSALLPEGVASGTADSEAEVMAFGGLALRKVRERLNVDLTEISKEMKVRAELLRAVEDERFEALPEEAYLKGHLRNFAEYLGLRPEKVVEDYLGRYRAWRKKK
ncbi:MAG: helix-turn-helix domain-containing protein [Candidatus Aminicenantes bacterium]|nr:helix-turn-helix domain-containing protein [Candidatus Aminicenantes bacterium]